MIEKSLVLAETPAQGRDYVAGLDDKFVKSEGHYLGQKYIVTWALGPLVELEEPEGYDPKYKNKDFSVLPILPEEVRYRIKKDESGKYKRQFATIKRLLNREDVKTVVIGTDPGREGELIARLILLLAENQKPVYRYWTSKALTPDVIRTGFSSLKKAVEYDRLFNAAQARQVADWLIGMNGSRAFSIKLHNNFPVGRVQTPALALLCKRENEITNFVPRDFWQIRVRFIHENGSYEGIWVNKEVALADCGESSDHVCENSCDLSSRIFDKETADQITEDIEFGDGTIISCVTSNRILRPPLLFSLNTLQQEANRVLGFTADQTKKIAQSLYNTHKLVSYPQPDQNYLHPDSAADITNVFAQLSEHFQFDRNKVIVSYRDKRVFDSSKVTEHHALIPTGNFESTGAAISTDEEKVFNLIVNRFISAFYPDFERKITTIVTEIENHRFVSTFKEIINIGWKERANTTQEDVELPVIEKGDLVSVYEVELDHGKTSPPDRFTDATLLEAMSNIHNFVGDSNHLISERIASLGTPSTQATTITKLLKAEYIVRKGRSLVPLEKGMRLIRFIGNDKIANPVYSAEWELELEKVANGEISSAEHFLATIREDVIELVKKASTICLSTTHKNGERNSFGSCPACGKGDIYEGNKSYFCSDYKEGCTFKLWKSCMKRFGKEEISLNQVKDLVAGKKVKFIGLKSPKSGNKFISEVILNNDPKFGWGVTLAY